MTKNESKPDKTLRFAILAAAVLLILCNAVIGTAGADDNVCYIGDDPTNLYTSVQEAVNAAGTGDTITMIADSTEETITVSKEVTLNLAGHVLKNTGSGSVIKVESSGNLTVIDGTPATEHWFNYPAAGSAWTLYTGSTAPTDSSTVKTYTLANFNLTEADAFLATQGNNVYIKVTGGIITGGNTAGDSPSSGGGVYVNSGRFRMEGGSIIGNKSSLNLNNPYDGSGRGSGVYVTGSGIFNVTGGSIAGNGGGAFGGGVYVIDSSSQFNMSGSVSIIGNSAVYGGGVCAGSTFKMTGGSITQNSAGEGEGGGVVVGDWLAGVKGTFTAEGGSIAGNIAKSGGGVYVEEGTFTMSGGTIEGNSANGSSEKGDGGGVYVYSGTFNMSGGTIKENSANCSGDNGRGGGVYVSSYGTMNLSGGSITQNSAKNGGGVYVNRTLNVSGSPVIKSNTTGTNAGNVYLASENALHLTGEFSGDIRITEVSYEAPAEGDSFGIAEKGASGAKYFSADGAKLVGSISGTDLVWKVGPVTVTFDTKGHGEPIASQTVDIGSKVAKPEDPSVIGYTFGGWYTDSGCSEDKKWDFETGTVSGDMTLYAKWDLVFYIAKMEGYTYGAASLPVPYITPDGITDAVFFYSNSATGTEIPWDTVTSAYDINAGTWYIGAASESGADIHRSTFTVEKAPQNAPSFTANERGGEITVTISGYDSEKTYMYSVTEQAANAAENWQPVTDRTFTIAGLKTGTTYEIKVKILAKGNYAESPASSQTVTTGSTFSVTYSANGGVGSLAPQTGVSGEEVTIASPADQITREGHDFTEWNTKADGSGTTYLPGDTVTEGVTLYAQWLALPYTITFDANGGSVTPSSLKADYDKPVDLSTVTASRNGHIHSGWALSKNGGAVYAATQQVTNLGDITLYAVWTPSGKAHGLTVNVQDVYETPVSGASVILKQGSANVKPEARTPESGSVSFTEIPEGIYTLTVTSQDGKIVTKSVTITGQQEEKIIFPAGDVSSVVKVSDENATPAIAVAGVDTVAEGAAEDGKSVTVKVTVEAKTEGSTNPDDQVTQIEIEKIKKEAGKSASGSELQYLGITVEKTVSESGKEGTTTKIPVTSEILEFIIPYDFTNKDQVKLYRCHDGTAEPLTQIDKKPATPADGTYWLDKNNGLIYLYANQFSTYCVGYVPVSPQPSHKSSSSGGSSIWATPTPEPTVTPT
ncbi:MAG: InlB B-repeat-containing protein, partial [Methanocorpusculum sp.]|nr:InlB B-repeat-containing protein [Methanocorpusculum sp.]